MPGTERLDWRRVTSRAALQSGAVMAMRVASVLCSIGAAAVALRLLGPNNYGYLVLILAAGPWLILCSLGTNERLTQAVVLADREGNLTNAFPLIKTGFILSGVAGAGAAVIGSLLFGALVHPDGATENSVMIAACITIGTMALTTPFGVASPVLVGQGHIALDGFYKLLQPFAYFLLSLVCLHQRGWSEGHALVLLSCAYALSHVIARLAALKSSGGLKFLKSRADVDVFREMVRSAWPFLTIQFAALLAFQSDRFLVAAFGSTEELGSYDIILRIYTALYLLFSVPLQHLWRDVGRRNADQDWTGIIRHVFSYVSGSIGFWILAIAVVAGTSPIATSLISQDKLPPAAVSVSVLLGMFFLIRGATDVLTLSLYAMGRQRETVTFGIAHAVAHLLFSMLGGMALGVQGMLLGQIVAFLISSCIPFSILVLRSGKNPLR